MVSAFLMKMGLFCKNDPHCSIQQEAFCYWCGLGVLQSVISSVPPMALYPYINMDTIWSRRILMLFTVLGPSHARVSMVDSMHGNMDIFMLLYTWTDP
jgi:hypothetical protein